MPRLELGDIDLDTSLEIKKRRNSRMFEIATNQGSIAEDQSPFSKDNMKRAANSFVKVTNKQAQDIQNIGSGTRCIACGMLHFCWTPECAICGEAMHYNLGGHHQ
tara:strand:+ start:269 stop:583 length:315 start_codon:yes stop_codon:yes gene_type:complete